MRSFPCDEPLPTGRQNRDTLWVFWALKLGWLLFLPTGCYAFVPPSGEPQSVGHPSSGFLRDPVSLPEEGVGYVRARPGESTRFGTPTLVNAIERAAAQVAAAYPGTAPLRVGDLSWPNGGRHPRHGSHRSGRDVDVIFYATDASGRSVRGRGWLAYGRHGVARETVATGAGGPSNDLFFFDDARNWAIVRALLSDPEISVQWIFCSRGIKARLLEYAMALGEDPEVVFRASWVLHQPSRGNPHADHFHIRVGCTAEEQSLGCINTAPIWPWIRNDSEKPATAAELTDEMMLRAMVGEGDDAGSGDELAGDVPT